MSTACLRFRHRKSSSLPHQIPKAFLTSNVTSAFRCHRALYLFQNNNSCTHHRILNPGSARLGYNGGGCTLNISTAAAAAAAAEVLPNKLHQYNQSTSHPKLLLPFSSIHKGTTSSSPSSLLMPKHPPHLSTNTTCVSFSTGTTNNNDSKRVIETPSGIPLDDYLTQSQNNDDTSLAQSSTTTQYTSTTTNNDDEEEYDYDDDDDDDDYSQESKNNNIKDYDDYYTILSKTSYEMSLDELESIVIRIEKEGELSNIQDLSTTTIDDDDDDDGNNVYENQYFTEMDILHKILTSCAQHHSTRGAELAERILIAVLLRSKQQQQRQEIDDTTTSTTTHSNNRRREGPTREMYTVAMNGWVKSQQTENGHHNIMDKEKMIAVAQRAHQILDYMWDEYYACIKRRKKNKTTNKRREKGSLDTATATATATAADDDDDSDTELVVVKPDVIHYTIVLQALARTSSKEAANKAQSLLEDAERLSGIRDILIESSRSSRSHIEFKGEEDGRTEKEEKAEAAAAHQKRMEGRIRSLDANLVPDRNFYNDVIYNWSQFPSQGRIRRIIQRMTEVSTILQNEAWLPNTRTYNLLISSCGKQSRNSGKDAEQVLIEMIQEYERREKMGLVGSTLVSDNTMQSTFDDEHAENATENSILPNIKSYNGVINAWTNEKSVMGAKRAEQILKAFFNYQAVVPALSKDYVPLPIEEGVIPDKVTFNSVINAWAQSGSRDAPERAQMLLDILTGYRDDSHDRFSTSRNEIEVLQRKEVKMGIDRFQIEADIITYNLVMKAWSQNRKDGAQRAEAILLRLLKGDDETDSVQSVSPNAISFSIIIQAYANSQDVKCGEKVEELLNLMHSHNLQPSKACYAGVLSAWLNQASMDNTVHVRDSIDNALKRMKEEGGYFPSRATYNAILATYARDINGDTDQNRFRSRDLIMSMIDDSSQNKGAPKPDVFSYNHVLKSYTQCVGDPLIQREGLFSAIDTFNHLCTSKHTQPIDQTYIQMSKIIQRLLVNGSQEQADICKSFFLQTCNAGFLTNAILRITENVLPPSVWNEVVEANCTEASTGPITIYQLPRTWSHRRREGQNQRRNRHRKEQNNQRQIKN